MPVYVLNTDSMSVAERFERSPRIALVTDASPGEPLPAELSGAADSVRHQLAPWNHTPAGHDGCLLWMAGDRLLQSDPYALRHHFVTAHRRYFVAVHLPCLPEADLIGVQPRWWTREPAEEVIAQRWRIAGASSPSPKARRLLENAPEPWARLHLALLSASTAPAGALQQVAQLWQPGLPEFLAALVIRNLALLLWQQQHHEEVATLLREAAQNYPAYAEIPYLAACWHLQQGRVAEAIQSAQAAVAVGKQNPGATFGGSGGEGTYRAQYLIGSIAEQLGDQQAAFVHYVNGVRHIPAFAPAAHGILRQQLPAAAVESLEWDLRRMARRERPYVAAVFDFFLRHRRREAARAILDTFGLPDGEREPMEERWQQVFAPRSGSVRAGAGVPSVCLRGPLFASTDAARLSRQLAGLLATLAGVSFRLQNDDFRRPGQLAPLLAEALQRPQPGGDEVEILFAPPIPEQDASRRRVLLLDWAWNSIPREWAAKLRRFAEAIWVTSPGLKEALVRAGLPAGGIFCLPRLVDLELFRPGSPEARPASRAFTFLLTGSRLASGLLPALRAFALAFSRNDPVRLVVVQSDPSLEDGGDDLFPELATTAAAAFGAQLVCREGRLPDADRTALLHDCDAVVHAGASRDGADWLLEAAACGVPVITTAAANDTVPGLAVAARVVETHSAPTPAFWQNRREWSEPLVWMEPDVADLARALRELRADSEANVKAVRVSEAVHLQLQRQRDTLRQQLPALLGR